MGSRAQILQVTNIFGAWGILKGSGVLRRRHLFIGGRDRDHFILEELSKRPARPLGCLKQLLDLFLSLVVVHLVRQGVPLAHGLEVQGVVGGDDGQGTLHPSVEEIPELTTNIAVEGHHTALQGATSLATLVLEGVTERPDHVLQILVVLDLILEGSLECPRGLSGISQIFLQPYIKIETGIK
jgi:hypothetical protein